MIYLVPSVNTQAEKDEFCVLSEDEYQELCQRAKDADEYSKTCRTAADCCYDVAKVCEPAFKLDAMKEGNLNSRAAEHYATVAMVAQWQAQSAIAI